MDDGAARAAAAAEGTDGTNRERAASEVKSSERRRRMRSASGGCTYVFCLDIVSLQRIVRGTTVGWSAGIEDGAEMITLGERDGNDSMHQQGGAATTEEEREASGAKRRCSVQQ